MFFERQPPGRKRRTREHVLAELSVNYLERRVLECGYGIERLRIDYGIDVDVVTFDTNGDVESGFLRFQLKATDHPNYLEDQTALRQRVAVADLKTWLFELYPMILMVYDAAQDHAYWLDVQEYVNQHEVDFDAKTVTLRIPISNRLTADTVRSFREVKNARITAGRQQRS